MSFVSVTGLTKRFGKTTVFQNIHFTIEQGEFITLLGPSGCGKSTLLRTLAGLTEPDAGVISVAGRDIGELRPKDHHIAMVLPSDALFPNMTVAQNIALGLKMKKIPRPEIESRVQRMMHLVHLAEKAGYYPRQLSGGQQHRVALARALVAEPQILLLDEPQSALDAQIRKTLRLQIRELQKSLNITTIFATQDQEEALSIPDRIFLMEQGRFAQIGAPVEIYTQPRSDFVARFISNYNVFRKEEFRSFAASSLEGEMFAVRPESIEMAIATVTGRPEILDKHQDSGHLDGIRMEGMVIDSIVLGNIRRNFVRVDQRTLMVDLLNRSGAHFAKPGQSVTLFIPHEDCLCLKRTHHPLKMPA